MFSVLDSVTSELTTWPSVTVRVRVSSLVQSMSALTVMTAFTPKLSKILWILF